MNCIKFESLDSSKHFINEQPKALTLHKGYKVFMPFSTHTDYKGNQALKPHKHIKF